jgi:hypothetical protein
MSDLNLTSFSPLYPMRIHPYQELFNDQNVNVIDKVNSIIDYLNQVGKLTNDVVKDWNTVYNWVMNDGLTTDVNNKLEIMLANHEFDSIISTVVAKVGDLTTLTTIAKDTIVHSINELVNDLATTNITLTNLGYVITGADPTGVTDATSIFQSTLNKGGKIIIPSGVYSVGGLRIPSNTEIVGLGKVTLKYNGNGFNTNAFGNVIFTTNVLPAYVNPNNIVSLVTDLRSYQVNLSNNITIKNITLDMQNSTTCGGIQLICVDFARIEDVFIINGREGLDLRAIRYSTFKNVYCDNIREDVVSVTDQNFMYVNGATHRGISRDLLFENCRVTNSCFTNGSSTAAGMNAFEMDDGMYNVTFRNCLAQNNNGIGFEIHLHGTNYTGQPMYDMQNIHFINCRSLNNVPVAGATASVAQVSGFDIGQCPDGYIFKNITYENCISIGSPTAFKNSSGSQAGYKENVSIIGGYFENTWIPDGTINSYNTGIYLGKQFRSFKILGVNVSVSQDGYAFYSYANADGVKISNVSIKQCYIPLGLTHTGGRAEINNLSFVTTNPSNLLSSICLAIECDDITINGLVGNLDQSKYSASILRLIQNKRLSVSGVIIENTGTLGNNGIQLDTVGHATLIGNVIKNFTNAIFFSNTSTSVVVSGNNFQTCTNKYNTVPSYLVDGINAL